MVKKYRINVWQVSGYGVLEIKAKDELDLYNQFMRADLNDVEMRDTPDRFIADVVFKLWQNRWFEFKDLIKAEVKRLSDLEHLDIVDHKAIRTHKELLLCMDYLERGEKVKGALHDVK